MKLKKIDNQWFGFMLDGSCNEWIPLPFTSVADRAFIIKHLAETNPELEIE